MVNAAFPDCPEVRNHRRRYAGPRGLPSESSAVAGRFGTLRVTSTYVEGTRNQRQRVTFTYVKVTFVPATRGSAGVAQPRGDAVEREQQRPVAALPRPARLRRSSSTWRKDMGSTYGLRSADGALQRGVVRPAGCACAGDGASPSGACAAAPRAGCAATAGAPRGGREPRVARGDAPGRSCASTISTLSTTVRKKGHSRVHAPQQRLASGLLRVRVERAAHAVPAREDGAVLRPGEHPGNRAQGLHARPPCACSGASRWAARAISSTGVTAVKNSHEARVLPDERAVGLAPRLRERVEDGAELRLSSGAARGCASSVCSSTPPSTSSSVRRASSGRAYLWSSASPCSVAL